MRLSGRSVARAALVAAAGAGLVLGATRLPASWAMRTGADASADASSAVAPALTGASVVCPGSELMGARGVDDVLLGGSVVAATAPARALAGLELSAKPGAVRIAPLASGRAASSSVTKKRGAALSYDYSGPRAVMVTGTQSLSAGLVAGQQWAVSSDTVRGLVSSACGEATSDAWLLAGGGDPGRQERLLLANPSSNPVTVDVELHGAKGVVDSPNGGDIVVPPRSRVNFLVDAISGSEPTPAVHISTRGGLVRAVLNDTWLDGARAAGSDDAGPTAPPSTHQVIPAVPVDGTGRVRVGVPGDQEAVVQTRALTVEGPKALPSGGVRRVAGGAVADIDLTGLPNGFYAIEVKSDVPVVAGASVSRRTAPDEVGDFAWIPSARPAPRLLGMAVPEHQPGVPGTPARSLALTASGDDVVAEVLVATEKGATTSQRTTVSSDTVAEVKLPAGTASVWVRRLSGGELRGAVVTQIPAQPSPFITVTSLAEPVLEATASRVVPLP
jgi:hypothetical protein